MFTLSGIPQGSGQRPFMFTLRGIPQGSCQRPFMFDIFMNVILYFMEICNVVKYTNDNILSLIANTSQ